MPAPSANVSFKLPTPLAKRFEATVEGSGIDKSTLLRGAVEALCSYYEEHQSITFPMQMAPRSAFPTAEEIASGNTPPNPTPGRAPGADEMRAAWMAWEAAKGVPRPASETPIVEPEEGAQI